MSRHKQIDLRRVKTISIRGRKSKVQLHDFAQVFDPEKLSFSGFVSSLPHVLVADDLRAFVGDVLNSVKRKKPIIAMLGAHVVKVGLGPLIVDLVEKKILTCVALNSAATIHDVEIAMWGKTSEDVEENILDGKFRMSRETGEFINRRLTAEFKRGKRGYGEVLGAALQNAPNADVSIIAACYRRKIPATVHTAIGTDIIHQQPSMNGAATGELTFRDFKVLCDAVKDLRGGGVVMNIGSAVVLPEVFLKALTVARNLGYQAKGFTTANFDMIQHYRPRMNVVQRPTRNGGRGYLFTGHHEIMLPLVCAMIKDRLSAKS